MNVPTSIRVGRIFGVPVQINLSILFVAAFVVWTVAFQILPAVYEDSGTRDRLAAAIASSLLFFISILAHEVGHAVVARRHDVETESITLWFLGGVAKLLRQAPTPRAEFQIAAAGPAASFIMALIFAGATWLTNRFTGWELMPVVLAWLAAINLLLAVSNMFPAAPLDGGRVLTAGLWKRLGDAELARLLSARCGMILGGAMTIAGSIAIMFGRYGFGWLSIVVMGLFLLFSARSEVIGAAVRGRLNHIPVAALMTRYPTPQPGSLSVAHYLSATASNPNVATPLTHWGHEPVAYALPNRLSGMDPFAQSVTTIGSIAIPADVVPRAWSTEPLGRVTERLAQLQPTIVVVHDPTTGAEIGTISSEQFGQALVVPDYWGRLAELVRLPEDDPRGPLVPGSGRR